MSESAKKNFEAAAKKEGFAVEFSREVTRVVRYKDQKGSLDLTFDLGSKGNRSISLDRFPAPIGDREKLAIDRTKRFLEACGFEVELP